MSSLKKVFCNSVLCLFAGVLILQADTQFAGSPDWPDWQPPTHNLPIGWSFAGKGELNVLEGASEEKHATVQIISSGEGEGCVFWNYNLHGAYQPETMVRYKVRWDEPCLGVLNFANDGGGGRGGAGVYFTKEGKLEVGDERGVRTELGNYKTGVWYEVVAYLSLKSDNWDVEATDLSSGNIQSLKDLPWSNPGVFKESAYAGPAISLWSKGSLCVSEITVSAPSDAVLQKKTPASPLISVPQVSTPPRLDGAFYEEDWKSAAHIGTLFNLTTGMIDQNRCDVYVTYDAKNLYIAFRQPLQGSRDVQPRYYKRDDPVYMDDCFEFLFDTTNRRDSKTRYHFVGNAAGTIYDEKDGDKAWNGNWNYKTKVTDNAWSGTISIALSDLNISSIRDGDTWGFNIGRSLLSHDAMLSTTYSTWSLPSKAELGFLDTPHFGTLLFRGDQSWVNLEALEREGGNFHASIRAFNPSDHTVDLSAHVLDGSALMSDLARKDATLLPYQSAVVDLVTSFPKQCRLTVETKDGGNLLLRQDALNPSANQARVAVRPFPLKNILQIDLDVSQLRGAAEGGFVPKLRILSSDKKKTWMEQKLEAVSGEQTQSISISDLPVGDYIAEITLQARNGQPVSIIEKSFVRGESRPEWFVHPVAMEDRLLAGFTPVKIATGKSGERLVSVWGRQHDFGNGALPRQVMVRASEGADLVPLLAGPIELVAGDKGQATALVFNQDVAFDSRTTKATWTSRTKLPDGHETEIRTTVEFDGMMRFDLKLPAGTSLDRLEIRVPLQHVSQYYTSVFDQYASEAGRLPSDGFSSSFCPLIWAGDMERGCYWFCESDQLWSPENPAKGLSIQPQGKSGQAMLLAQWIGQPTLLAKATLLTFGLQVSPVKPLPTGSQIWRVGRDFDFPWYEQFNDALTQPMVHRPDFHELVELEHERGCAVLPYFFPTSMKASARDCLAYKNEWGHLSDLPDVEGGEVIPPDMKMQIDSSWADYFLAGLEVFVRDFKIDGVYYDTTGPFRRSCTDDNGRHFSFWPIFATRNFHIRTANIFEKYLGPGNYILLNHMSDNMDMPTLSPLTLAFDGEQYNRVPVDAKDYTALLPLERAEVINNPEHWGFPCMFLPEIPIRKDPETRRNNRLITDSLLSILLPLGDSWWDGPIDYLRQKQIADAMMKFGVGDASFHPYWRQKEVLSPNGVLVSYYLRADRRMLIVSNPGQEARQVDLTLSGLKISSCKDLLNNAAIPVVGLKIEMNLDPASFRLLVLE